MTATIFSSNVPVGDNGLRPVKRALLSVSEKTHLEDLARALCAHGCRLVATGTTHVFLTNLGLPCDRVEDLTGHPEILGGRVKTLHPKIFGGILAQQDDLDDQRDIRTHDILLFDLVVCNLYPFQEAAESHKTYPELIEKIDIGGVSLLRAAAKNQAYVSILSHPNAYADFVEELDRNGGSISLATRRTLALRAFQTTSEYDGLILATLQKLNAVADNPSKTVLSNAESSSLSIRLTEQKPLRYGENPHQPGWFYRNPDDSGRCNLADLKCLAGKELSYNNLLDTEHATRLVAEFPTPVVVILKHNNPCGVATDANASVSQLFARAFASDRVSPFGGIVCTNREVDADFATLTNDVFLELIVAPAFSPQALEIFRSKKNLRLVVLPTQGSSTVQGAPRRTFAQVQGGFLVQDCDDILWKPEQLKCVTVKQPSSQQMQDAHMAFVLAKHLRSNAIAVVKDQCSVGLAGGFTNRVDAVNLCLSRAQTHLDGAVLASDAFFPFADSIDLIRGTGIALVIQPGGSVQDKNVIAACDAAGIVMVFTGTRHFKH